MRIVIGQSIAFRLWLALSFLAVAFTALAFTLYIWLGVRDDIHSAHTETQGKIDAVIAVAAVFGVNEGGPSPSQTFAAENLGIIGVEVVDALGNPTFTLGFGNSQTQMPPVDPSVLTTANAGPVSQTLHFRSNTYSVDAISPFEVVAGGTYGEERIVALSSLNPAVPPGQGFVRVVARYPDLTGQAHGLIIRSLIAASIIIGALLVGIWPFLNHFVARPMRRYSNLAMQIAIGRQVRMPADGQDELSQLGRAVNGMADALGYQATVDALTGLFNLRHLSSNLESLLSIAAMRQVPLCVIVGDLDNLKPVNDTFGHQAGDSVLRSVGNAIAVWAGTEYTCWRLGGDEFVVALPNTTEAEALVRAATLRQTINDLTVSVADTIVRPSISVGVAAFPLDGDTAGALLGIADRRMYSAKARQAEDRRLASSSAA